MHMGLALSRITTEINFSLTDNSSKRRNFCPARIYVGVIWRRRTEGTTLYDRGKDSAQNYDADSGCFVRAVGCKRSSGAVAKKLKHFTKCYRIF